MFISVLFTITKRWKQPKCLSTDNWIKKCLYIYKHTQHSHSTTFAQHSIKHTSIHIMGSQKEKREKGAENIFEEIIAENFPNMGKEKLTKVQEAQRVTYRINPRRNRPRHILIKLTKIKNKEKGLPWWRSG